MALLERYLHAVGSHLPAAEEHDIIAELRDDIQARFDERAAELGRDLTEDEQAELLKPYGRPILLASRYGKRRHLVGPNLFPFYWNTLKIALAVALIATLAVLVLFAIAGRPINRVARALLEFPTRTAVTIFGWVTLVFAGLDLFTSRAKFKDSWNPRTLPRVASRLPRPFRFSVAIELVLAAVFVTWWTAIQRAPDLLFLPAQVALAPAWSTFYMPVLVVVIASMLVKSVTLVRPDWTTFRFGAGLLTTAAGLVVASMVLRAGQLVVPGAPGVEAEQLAARLNPRFTGRSRLAW